MKFSFVGDLVALLEELSQRYLNPSASIPTLHDLANELVSRIRSEDSMVRAQATQDFLAFYGKLLRPRASLSQDPSKMTTGARYNLDLAAVRDHYIWIRD